MTIKAHKPAGESAPRIIHVSHLTVFKPVLRFIAWQFRQVLGNLSHILRDSVDLAKRLRPRRFPANSVMYKVDIKDFYMSEGHGETCDASASVIEPPRVARACRRMEHLILTNQLVSWPGSEEVYRVTTGSGMGQLCSDEPSSISFYLKVEQQYTLDPEVRRKYGVLQYLRFKDDIFILASGPRSRHVPFSDEMFSRSGCCKLKIDEVSSSYVNMSDIEVSKSHGFGRSRLLDLTIYVKPTFLGAPLHYTSVHPYSVHVSWPVAVCTTS